MSEQKQQPKKKRPGIVRRIFKWIALILFAGLIVLAVYFQAPWKVIALLLVIFLASTVVPKRFCKWVWLSAGLVVIALVVWVFLPDDNEGWRPYTFDEEFAALEAKYAIPDSENAAVIYNKLLADYDPDTFYPEFWNDELDDITNEPWASKDHPELAQWLTQQQATIETLMLACSKEKCNFPIIANILDLGKESNRLGPMKRWAVLLIRAGNNDLGDGRIDEALGKYLCALQMAKHQCQQPTMVDCLVGIAIEDLVLRQFNGFVVTGDATEQYLNIMEEAVAAIEHNWASAICSIIETDTLQRKNAMLMTLYEVNIEGKTRLSRDTLAGVKAELPEEIPPLTYWQRKLIKAGIILGWFIMPSTPQKVGKIIDDAYERFYAMAEPDFDWEKEPREFKFSLPSIKLNFRFMIESLLYLFEPFYYRNPDIYNRAVAKQKSCQLIIELRRYKNQHGLWPESLDEIQSLAPAEIFVDATNGDSFAYKLTEENFTLYSKGKNNIDEGGEYKGNWPEEAEPDDWLIWPRKSCKDKEENANDEQ